MTTDTREVSRERSSPAKARPPAGERPQPRMRTRARREAKPPLPAAVKLALALVLPLAGLLVVAVLLQSGSYELNTARFANLLFRATVIGLACSVALTMFVAVFGRDGEALPIAARGLALVFATAALVLGLLFGVLW